MIPEGFARTGWHITPPPAPATRFQVMGERSSGTNFVKRLIGRNSPMRPMEDLGWKHGFAQMTAIPEDVVIVACVRDARAWALSMHAKPWHCPPAMQALPFADFIRAEWATVADRERYFPQVAAHGGQGQPLQHDRHPLTGEPFGDLFALRQTKLQALLSYGARGCGFVLCRLEAVQAAPESFLATLHDRLQITPPDTPYRPVMKRLGSKFLPAIDARPQTPDTLSSHDLTYLRSVLDLETEARLGYDYA